MRTDMACEARVLINRDSTKAVRPTREMYREDMVLVGVYRDTLE